MASCQRNLKNPPDHHKGTWKDPTSGGVLLLLLSRHLLSVRCFNRSGLSEPKCKSRNRRKPFHDDETTRGLERKVHNSQLRAICSQVLKVVGEEMKISCMQQAAEKRNSFAWPQVKDITYNFKSDIQAVISKPEPFSTRQMNSKLCNFDWEKFMELY